jgi:hypothetical protein
VQWLFCFFVLLMGVPVLCQKSAPIADQSLTLEKIGNGYWGKHHRPFGFRVYSTPDGTSAYVQYQTFSSRAEAKQYVAKWVLRPGPEARIIYRQETKDANGQIVGERIIASAQIHGKKVFGLVRGIRLDYYLIGSSSLAAAMQVEETIDEH